MNNQLTELIFVLDRSGSMAGLESDTIGGFNSMISTWKEKKIPVLINTVLFDTEHLVLHDRVKIEDVPPLTAKEYWARGATALYDAVGRAIRHIGKVHKYIREEDVPGHVVVIITTDGYENSSEEYSGKAIHDLIARQKEKGWEFIFLGADIDAHAVAEEMNIDQDMAFSLKKNRKSVQRMYSAVGATVECCCSGPAAGPVDRSMLREELKDSLNESQYETPAKKKLRELIKKQYAKNARTGATESTETGSSAGNTRKRG